MFPEYSSSAAGVRTFGLIQKCIDLGLEVGFGTGAKQSSNATFPSETKVFRVRYNNTNDIVKTMGELDPDLVVFDRFLAEEAYASRVREIKPSAMRVLDMQDMHSLRRHRETNPFPSIPSPSTSTSLVRELASINRSDLSIVCSSVEKVLLEMEYKIPGEKLQMGSFFTSPIDKGYDNNHSFNQRKDFISIGGFKHPPNVDSAVWLVEDIWPRISKKIPDAVLNIYGAYPTRKISSLHSPSDNVHVHGFVPSLEEPFLKSRVLLAPLRFGAGVKGKIIDAFRFGCPVVTTKIGSEGIGKENEGWGGAVTSNIDCAEEFADAAVALYNDRDRYESSRAMARKILVREFDETRNLDAIVEAIQGTYEDLERCRERDVFGNILWHSSNRATEYFSRYIELKEKNRREEVDQT